jgi:hypothetical protein
VFNNFLGFNNTVSLVTSYYFFYLVCLQPKVDWQLKADTLVCEKAVLEEEKAELVKKNLELAEQLKDIQGKFKNFEVGN